MPQESSDTDDNSGKDSEDQGYDTASNEIKDVRMSSEDSSNEPAHQNSSGKYKRRSRHNTQSNEKLAEVMEGILQVMRDKGNDPKPSTRRRRRPQQTRKSAIDNEVKVIKRAEPAAIRNFFLVCVLLLMRIWAHLYIYKGPLP